MGINTEYRQALLLAGLATLASSFLLYLIIGRHGTFATWDSIVYLNGAINLIHGNGIAQRLYADSMDAIVIQPVTHYPPLLSIAYAFLLSVGVPLTYVPATLNLICWVAFLGGVGLLTRRLGGTPFAAAIAVVLAAMTNTYLRTYQHAMSEALFLPLLVWAVVVLADPPEPHRFAVRRMGVAIILLALMLLTRYVGVVLFAGVLVWWFWWRLYQGQPRRLLWELPILGLPVLPLAAWLVRNRLVAQSVVGEHLESSEFTFFSGIVSALYQISQLVLPAMRPLHEFALLDVPWTLLNPILVVFLAILIGGLILLGTRLWAISPQHNDPRTPPRSPALPVIAAYAGLYTVVQPFAQFYPMDERDIPVILCLAHPWLLAAITQVWQQRSYRLITGYVILNLLFVLVPVSLSAVPNVITLVPPQVRDLYEYPDRSHAASHAGVPQWLLVNPFRTTTIERYYPDVMEFLRQYDSPVVVESNFDHALFYNDINRRPPVRTFKEFKFRTLEDWLEQGSCRSQFDKLVIILERDYHHRDRDPPQPGFEDHVAAVERKCPAATRIPMEHGIIYELPAIGAPGAPE